MVWLVLAVLTLAWGAVGGNVLEDRLLAAVAKRVPTARRVLPFAVGTVVVSALLQGSAIRVVDESPALAAILLIVQATGIFVLMPVVMLCMPTQSSGVRSLVNDLQRAGIEERPARRWAAVMAPWAFLMLMLYVLALVILAVSGPAAR